MSSNQSFIFVPDTYVPLSRLYRIDSTENKLSFSVAPQLLSYIGKGDFKLYCARKQEERIEYLTPTLVDETGGQVILEQAEAGSYTVVSEALVNDFPIVTHWDKSLNQGLGGFSLGGSDAPGLLDINLEKGEIISETPIFDLDPGSPYAYLTDQYNLVSSGKGEGYCRVPSFEEYLGENFSLKRVTDRLAIWISDQALKETGYPVLFQNYPKQQRYTKLPLFQVVNNYIVAYEEEHPSLATFLLPPYWSDTAAKPYPVLFTGFYDSNDNFYLFSSISYMKRIADTLKETGAAPLGILWNGGGSAGARTLQLSAYHNLSELFEIAGTEFGADKEAIVAVGGSRGGITALVAAGNPYHNNYKVKYVICSNPIVRLSCSDYDVANPTSPMIYNIMSDDTGYKYSWRKEWRDPVYHLSGEQLLLHSLTGTLDKNIARDVFSLLPRPSILAMKEQGTRVFFYAGTHDVMNTKDNVIDLADRLLAQGIEVEFQLGYRFGHNNVEDLEVHAGQILTDMLRGREIHPKGVSHYRRASDKPEEWLKSEKFYPEHQPVFFEGPKKAAVGDRAAINIVGEAGMKYRLLLHRIDEEIWCKEQRAVKMDSGRELFCGTFEEKTKHLEGRISYFHSYLEFDKDYEPGWYLYEFMYSLEGTENWIRIGSEGIPQPDSYREPVLELLKEYPMISGKELFDSQNDKFIGWGLSEY